MQLVSGFNIGIFWFELLTEIVSSGKQCLDEGRERLALDNVCARIKHLSLPDYFIERHADPQRIEAMVRVMLEEPVIHDIDIQPSFCEAKSYYQRIEEGHQLEYVIDRLTHIPESKKAVITFPTYEDLQNIMHDHYRNDYLPCIVAIQFRIEGDQLHTTFFARSMDVFQKGIGNLIAITKLAGIVAARVGHNRQTTIVLGEMFGHITDAHIYQNCLQDVRAIVTYDAGN